MRYNIILSAVALLSATTLQAQTAYDATRYMHGELNGTARYVGMGGAMGALGADVSTMSTNPAGTALFRSSTLSMTLGFNNTGTKANFIGNSLQQSKTRMSFDQLGFISSTHVGNRGTLRFFNIGFNYQKRNNLNHVFQSAGVLPNGISQTQQMVTMLQEAGVNTAGQVDDIYNYGRKDEKGNYYKVPNPYNNINYPYLGVMGIRTGLVAINQTTNALIGFNADQFRYETAESGGVQQFDVNLSFNLNDRIYLGATIGGYSIDYNRATFYKEAIFSGKQLADGSFQHEGAYMLLNDFHTEGTGLDLKVGAIFRPLEDSPFRIGLAIHTPTWFQLKDIYTAYMESDITYDRKTLKEENVVIKENTLDYTDGETLREYSLTTPWRFNLSAGTTLGGIMALGAEYEYADYSSARLKYTDGQKMIFQNDYIKSSLKGAHTLKLGLETRIAPEFALRAGYNLTTSLFKKEAFKALDHNDMRTDVEFANTFARNTFTVGAGYSGKRFYADLAYKYDTTKSDFYAFSHDRLPATELTTDRHQVLCTLGVRF